MIQRPVDREDPDRLYTVTRGRSRVEGNMFDLVALIVAERPPEPGFQSEHAAILGADYAKELGLPVTICDPGSDQWQRIWRLWTHYYMLNANHVYENEPASQVYR